MRERKYILPKCDICHEEVDDDYYYVINDTCYCEFCMKKEFQVEVDYDYDGSYEYDHSEYN